MNFDRYPLPGWITQPGVYLAWLGLLPFGILGYWLYTRRQWWFAYSCLGLYAITGGSTPAHYFYAPMSHFSTHMNSMIWSDGLVSFSLIAFILRSILLTKEWSADAEN